MSRNILTTHTAATTTAHLARSSSATKSTAAIRIFSSTIASDDDDDDDDAVATASAIATANQEDVLALMSVPVGATSTGTSEQEALPPLLEIFHDTEHFPTYPNDNGKTCWRCGWCNTEFAGHNATKALHHIVRVKNKGIRVCDASIPELHFKRYFELYEKKMGAKSTKAGECYDCFLCSSCE